MSNFFYKIGGKGKVIREEEKKERDWIINTTRLLVSTLVIVVKLRVDTSSVPPFLCGKNSDDNRKNLGVTKNVMFSNNEFIIYR